MVFLKPSVFFGLRRIVFSFILLIDDMNKWLNIINLQLVKTFQEPSG